MTSEGLAGRRLDILLVGGALVASVILIWMVTGQAMVAAAYGGGLLALGGIAYALSRPRTVSGAPDFAMPDWSVTVAALERPDCAVAITDKANRLVCANAV